MRPVVGHNLIRDLSSLADLRRLQSLFVEQLPLGLGHLTKHG
jgi:hypothetical protein